MVKRLWQEDEGVLTFEWILLVTLLVIGLVGALSGVRDAINHELGSVAGAMVSLDQSYSISCPLDVCVGFSGGTGNLAGAVSSVFHDSAFWGETRTCGTTTQTVVSTLNCGS